MSQYDREKNEMSNQEECKRLLRIIMKMTHPDNYYSVRQSIPKGVEVYLSLLRNNAVQACENNDIFTLTQIISELNGETEPKREYNNQTSSRQQNTNSKTADNKSTATTLTEYFKQSGLEVIDKRKKGGALWVIGDKESIGHIVDRAISLYKVKGYYSKGGRTTKYRPAWWTTSDDK